MRDKQKRFCEEYIIDHNATQAAIRAGYSRRTAKSMGGENLTKPDLKNYIAELEEELKQRSMASAEEVLQYLTSVMRNQSRTTEVLIVGGEAQEIEKPPSEKERLKAAELLGKRHNLFSENVKVTGAVPVILSGEDDLEP